MDDEHGSRHQQPAHARLAAAVIVLEDSVERVGPCDENGERYAEGEREKRPVAFTRRYGRLAQQRSGDQEENEQHWQKRQRSVLGPAHDRCVPAAEEYDRDVHREAHASDHDEH